jgi:hypothetical protein
MGRNPPEGLARSEPLGGFLRLKGGDPNWVSEGGCLGEKGEMIGFILSDDGSERIKLSEG